MTLEAVERWFKYRDNRNDTAHDYGEQFAKETLTLITPFLIDVQQLVAVLEQKFGAHSETNNTAPAP
nr:nucleotidyltransferase substrate binding protein [Thiospirillum jenense]